MVWIKKHFFKVTTTLLLLIVAGLTWFSSEAIDIKNHISLPSYTFIDLKEYGYITVGGTLVSTAKDNIASKLNAVEFVCDLSSEQCTLTQAEIFDDSMLTLYTETFQITGWDDNFVTFETLPNNQSCVVWKYRIDRFNEELVARREKSLNYDYSTCMGIGLSEFGLKVVDGWDVISELRGYND